MERAVMTGITRVSKESIFSDLNNLEVVTTTSKQYNTSFGFTEEEVFDALDAFGMSEEKEGVKAWYDGFTFGDRKDIYNPWSITNFIKKKTYRAYWANTSSNGLVEKMIREGTSQTKTAMEDLISGKCLRTVLDEEIIFDQLQKKKGAIWSLLLASGYLKVDEKVFDKERGIFTYYLKLTNREVQMMFTDMIEGWFSDENIRYNEFIKSLLTKDVRGMNRFMNDIALVTFSSFDTGNRPSGTSEPERFYHGFVLGLIVELRDRYQIRSNRESGFGRYDVMLEPIDHKDTAYVLEFKVYDSYEEKTLSDTVQAALDQISEKDYDAELVSRGISRENIEHYGFAFEGKKVLIG